MLASSKLIAAAAILSVCSSAQLVAQNKQVPVHSFPFTPTNVQLGQITLQPDALAMKEIASLSEVILTGVPDASGRFVTLELHRAAVHFEPGSIRVNGVPQVDTMPVGSSLWSGNILGVPDSDAFLSISPFGTRGWFGAAEAMNHLLAQPVAGDWSQTTLRIVDQATLDTMGAPAAFTCDSQLPPGQAAVAPVNQNSQPMGGPLPNYLAPIAFETTFEFYTIFNNLGAAQTYAQSLIGAISNKYDSQIGVIFTVPYLGLYTTNTDPWTPAACGTMLDQFRNAWDNGAAPVAAGLYHLMTGSNCGGGVAYVNVLCNQNFGFGVSGGLDGTLTFPPAQGPLTWDFVVVAHELGHCFNAIHTHDYNPPIDSCGLGNCSNPANGTIMSYCHTCAGGMNNIVLNFHAQSAADMRAAVVASCFQTTTGGNNNECAGAVALSNGANGPFNNTSATTSAPAWPCGSGGKDNWYTYTATCNGDLTIATCGAPTNFDTCLEIFSGNCNALVSLQCNDDFCAQQSSITVTVSQGVTYYVRAGGFNGASGTFGLNVTCTGIISNDNCATATPLVVGINGPYTNVGATNSPQVFPCGSNVGKDVWFSYTAVANGPVTVNTCTAARTFDTVIEGFRGTCGALTSIGCNDDNCANGSRIDFVATTGTTYFFHVGGFSNSQGSFEVVLTAGNDECSSAITLAHGTNGVFSTAKATVSPQVLPCGSNNGPDVWFRYTAQGCRSVRFETCSANRTVDTVMEVFSGTCGALTSIACNDDTCGTGSRVTVPVATPGTTYFVHVAGYNGNVGSFDVIVTEGSGSGAFTTFPTGCGGLGFGPTGGLPVIGSSVGWQVTGNTGTPAILLGFAPINFPICPACILGATIDVVVNGATIPASPIPCDPLLIGGQVYLQGIDIGSAGGCVTPLPLRMSNTVRITIG